MKRHYQPFFDTPEKLDAFRRYADTWKNTPFWQGSCARGPGGGVDCIELVQDISVSQGIYPQKIQFPVYSLGHGQHAQESIILQYFRKSPSLIAAFIELPPDAPVRDGDIMGFICGRVVDHIAFVYRYPQIIHCLWNDQVRIHNTRAAFVRFRQFGRRRREPVHVVTFRPVMRETGKEAAHVGK